MRKHYYPHAEIGNRDKGTYGKPQNNTAEGSGSETPHRVPSYLSLSPDCIDHCQRWETALNAVNFFYIPDAKRLNLDNTNVKAHSFHGYLLYNGLGFRPSTTQGHHHTG